jgi:polysaccharide chain length determinant protein (PEP-CTERM system associated)
MANFENPIDIHSYIDIALRRKWLIIIPFVICVLISFGYYKRLPKVYKATTLILVQPPIRIAIPAEAIVERLSTISQEILSRTRLETVINEFNLYSKFKNNVHIEALIEMMRKSTDIRVQGYGSQYTFSISYTGSDPKTVMMVTNKLASLFIEDNLKIREERAEGTSEFLTKELQKMEEELKKKESGIRQYKQQHMGALPQQIEPNLRTLERFQQQLKITRESVRVIEERSSMIQGMIDETKKLMAVIASVEPKRKTVVREREGEQQKPRVEDVKGLGNPIITQWNLLNKELSNARSKYTENHPDVIDIKRRIAKIEPKVKELIAKQENAIGESQSRSHRGTIETLIVENIPPPGPDPATERLLIQYTQQYNELLLEAKRLKDEEKAIKEQIAIYQKRVEDAPQREQELVLLTRDYDRFASNYQSLLDKRIQAHISENLERKQQHEHFKILDFARIPEVPIGPNRNKYLLIGTFAGLALGIGLAWFKESLDQSFHTVSDLEDYLGIPVLATIPNLKEEKKAA